MVKVRDKISYVNWELLLPYYKNNKDHGEDQISLLVQAIDRFGFTNPLMVDENNVIIAGHARYKAGCRLGMKKFPVIYVDDLTESEKRALRISDNRITELASTNWDNLKDEWLSINEEDEDLAFLTGYTEEDINIEVEEDKEDNFEGPGDVEDVDTDIEVGSLIKLGDHYLLCGDSNSKDHIDRLLGDVSLSLVFTSPPYNMDGDLYNGEYEDNLGSEEFVNFNLRTVELLKDYLNGFLFWNMSYNVNSRREFLEVGLRISKDLGFNFLDKVVWNKKTALPVNSKDALTRTYEDIFVYSWDSELRENYEVFIYNNGREYKYNKKTSNVMTNYWEVDVSNVQSEYIQACFPVEIPKRGILIGTVEGDGVCDPFGGSGSTLIACEELGRVCYMMEYSAKYCELICRRWENYTGKSREYIN